MLRIHFFNPDHDYALSVNGPWYTPPGAVIRLTIENALSPLNWISPGDAILLSKYFDEHPILITDEQNKIIKENNVTLVYFKDIGLFLRDNPGYSLAPWGWNKSIAHQLLKVGVESHHIPSTEQLENIRCLSHRKITIDFNRFLGETLPVEFVNVEEAMEFYHQHPDCYFKAPWSSSGRGIISCGDLSDKHVRPWLHGIISRQGSVIAEECFPKALDFATEWKCSDGKAVFLGVSCFKTSRRGKYHGNIIASQEKLLSLIHQNAPGFGEKTISLQKEAIETFIAPFYSGPLGIDMMTSIDGKIKSCVEINLRMTMGHAALLSKK